MTAPEFRARFFVRLGSEVEVAHMAWHGAFAFLAPLSAHQFARAFGATAFEIETPGGRRRRYEMLPDGSAVLRPALSVIESAPLTRGA